MKTVGQILKAAREKKNLTLEDAAKQTRIRLTYLKALEKGDYQLLPSVVYIKGFLRNYAEFLQLPVDEVFAFFRREYNVLTESVDYPQSPSYKMKRWRIHLTPSYLMAMLGGLVIVGFLYFLYVQYSSFALAPILIIDQPQDKVEISEDFVIARGQTDADATLLINGQVVAVESDGAFSVRIDGLQDGLNTLIFVVKNDFDKERQEQRAVFVNLPQPTTKVVDKKSVPADKSELTVDLLIGPNSAWTQIYVDNKLTFEGVLVAGGQRSYTARDRIVIKSGNAGSTRVNVNGDDLGVLGDEGEVVEREYTLE